VKEKTDDEILDYYEFQRDGYLTNLGILWIGKRRDRSSLLFAPIIQVIRYNEREEKVWKFLLDDFTLNPKEMLESILRDVPDWQESIEIPDWAYRKNVPFYPIEVIRELCANSLAHRTYTMRGDIFINIYHDRMEIHSPGLLPYGVTPKNILSKSVRRNENLSKVFFDLNLMEREGSGYDMIYAKLLSIGKALPTIEEGDDRVTVTVQKGFVNRDIVRYMDRVIGEYSLKQKEIITLGLLAQRPYSATELSRVLIQEEDNRLRDWIGNLQEYGLVSRTGEKKATMYEIVPITTPDTTTRKDGYAYIDVEEQKELIYNDILTHPYSSVSEIHQRIGEAIDSYKLKRLLRTLLDKRMINSEGSRKTTKYFIKQNLA
jgi:ATP-dependent DNA helicase RecG